MKLLLDTHAAIWWQREDGVSARRPGVRLPELMSCGSAR